MSILSVLHSYIRAISPRAAASLPFSYAELFFSVPYCREDIRVQPKAINTIKKPKLDPILMLRVEK